VAPPIIRYAHAATASGPRCSTRAGVGDVPPPVVGPRRCGTSVRLHGTATLALLAFLAIGPRARALDLSGGPTDSPPGGTTCARNGDLEKSPLTLDCTISNPGAFADVYFGLANNSGVNGLALDGTAPSGREIFRYRSSTARSIVYTSGTTIENTVTGSAQNVNTRLVLTLTAGTGIVIDTAGNPPNNDNGDIQKLFRIASNTFSVRVDVLTNSRWETCYEGVCMDAGDFAASNELLTIIPNSPTTQVITSVNLGFYYLQCTP